MVGRRGVARSDLDPRGRVFVEGAIWSAVATGEPVILKGEPVRVVNSNGMVLEVERITVEEEFDGVQMGAVLNPSARGLETD
jgi:membrane-bound serine protease (ClpP class)